MKTITVLLSLAALGIAGLALYMTYDIRERHEAALMDLHSLRTFTVDPDLHVEWEELVGTKRVKSAILTFPQLDYELRLRARRNDFHQGPVVVNLYIVAENKEGMLIYDFHVNGRMENGEGVISGRERLHKLDEQQFENIDRWRVAKATLSPYITFSPTLETYP